jgi:hypothetical protein
MARSYKRDASGRFAGGGGGSGGGGKRPAAKAVSRGANRLTRDNAGKITGTGNGATARGGRLKTASGNQRATQTARAIGGSRAGTIKGKVTRNPAAGAKLAAAGKGKPAQVSKARLDGEAFGQRAKRLSKSSIRRSINESDRENSLTGSQRRSTDYRKRAASSQKRQANSDRTASRAREFYRNFGAASAFGRRPMESTASSPNFGSKRRGRRRK